MSAATSFAFAFARAALGTVSFLLLTSSLTLCCGSEDWDNGGATWEAFAFSLPGLRGGMSSRVVCGESVRLLAVSFVPFTAVLS